MLAATLACAVVGWTNGADAADWKNEMWLGAGVAFSRATPQYGGVVSASYARSIGQALWLVVRPEYIFNLEAPDGSAMKGSAFGMDVGVLWQLGHSDHPHLVLGTAIGGRGYLEPGFGVCLRLGLALHVPLVSSFEVVLGASEEGGFARLGDEFPENIFQIRGDLLVGGAYLF